MKRPLRHTWQALLGLVLLVFLLRSVPLPELSEALRSADVNWMLLAAVIFALQGVLEAWRLLLVFRDYHLVWGQALRLFFVGLFFANFLPGSLGADLYQIQQMHARESGLIKPAVFSFGLRVSGLLANVLAIALAVLLGASVWQSLLQGLPLAEMPLLPFLLAMAVLATIICALLMIGKLPGWALNFLRSCRQQLQAFLRFPPGVLSLLLILGLAVVLVRALALALLLFAWGQQIPFGDMLMVTALVALSMLLPLTVGGLGVREWVLVAGIVAAGGGEAEALMVALVSRGFIWGLSLIGGVWFALLGRTQQR